MMRQSSSHSSGSQLLEQVAGSLPSSFLASNQKILGFFRGKQLCIVSHYPALWNVIICTNQFKGFFVRKDSISRTQWKSLSQFSNQACFAFSGFSSQLSYLEMLLFQSSAVNHSQSFNCESVKRSQCYFVVSASLSDPLFIVMVPLKFAYSLLHLIFLYQQHLQGQFFTALTVLFMPLTLQPAIRLFTTALSLFLQDLQFSFQRFRLSKFKDYVLLHFKPKSPQNTGQTFKNIDIAIFSKFIFAKPFYLFIFVCLLSNYQRRNKQMQQQPICKKTCQNPLSFENLISLPKCCQSTDFNRTYLCLLQLTSKSKSDFWRSPGQNRGSFLAENSQDTGYEENSQRKVTAFIIAKRL